MANFTRRDVLRTGVFLPTAMSAAFPESSASEPGPKPIRLEEVSGFDVEAVVASHRLAILPLGSLEFHGPHNPLGTDSIIISGLSERIAVRTRALLLPTITFTLCPSQTAHFGGTISIRSDVMTMYIADILRNTLRLGCKRIFVLNGHDGNIGPGRGAISEVAHEAPDSAILFVNWWETLSSELMKKRALFSQANGGHGHGGPLETSAVAGFRPDLVRLSVARDLPEPPDLSGGPPYFLQKEVAPEWPGYSGKVSEASPEKGRQLLRISEDEIVNLVENWLNNDDAPGSW